MLAAVYYNSSCSYLQIIRRSSRVTATFRLRSYKINSRVNPQKFRLFGEFLHSSFEHRFKRPKSAFFNREWYHSDRAKESPLSVIRHTSRHLYVIKTKLRGN